MEKSYLSFEQLSVLFPDEWILLGNPVFERTRVQGGIMLYHSKDKKEVCYLGKEKTNGYNKITLAYTGNLRPMRRLGIMKRIS